MKNHLLLIIIFACNNLLSAQNLFPDNGEVFKDDVLSRIDIILPADSLTFILAEENQQSDYHFHATFIFDNETVRDTIENVGFRLRGNTSRSSDKKSYKISFNTYEPGRKYYGLEKMNLNGEHNDPTVMRAKTGWDLAREMGIIASRSNHVALYVNGDYFGIYLNVEHIDEEFVNLRYGNKNGNLYKCLWPADMAFLGADPDLYKLMPWNRRTYELLTNKAADDYSDLANLIKVLNNSSTEDLPCDLEAIFDVKSYIKVIAFDILTGNWDGPLYNVNNFYLYHNPTTGKFQYIPYDIDNTFGIDWFDIDWSSRNIYDWTNDFQPHPLYTKILAVDEYRELFTYYMRLFLETAYNPAEIFPRIDALKAQISSHITADPYYPLDYGFSFDDFNNSYNSTLPYDHTGFGLKPFITARQFEANQQLDIAVNAPIILKTFNTFPSIEEPILFSVKIVNTNAVESIELCYQMNGGGYTCFALLDDGMHNDEDESDGVYGGSLPAVNEATLLEYYIKITDNTGGETEYLACESKKIYIGLSAVPIFINEIMASNETVIMDEAGEYEDWVELYYTGNQPIYLGDKYLSDDKNKPTKWSFGDIWMSPNQFKVVWLDKDEEQGPLHAGFKLATGGEFIGIFDKGLHGNVLMDGFDFPEQTADIAYGRIPDATGAFAFIAPTPAYSNVPVGTEDITLSTTFSIYPNPFSDYLVLHLMKGEMAKLKWYLTDIAGKMLIQGKTTTLADKIRINTAALREGIYFVSIKKENKMLQTQKVVLGTRTK